MDDKINLDSAGTPVSIKPWDVNDIHTTNDIDTDFAFFYEQETPEETAAKIALSIAWDAARLKAMGLPPRADINRKLAELGYSTNRPWRRSVMKAIMALATEAADKDSE